MKPVKITYYTITRWEKSHNKPLVCAKCGTPLKNEDKAFKTARRYYCYECGSNCEIDA